MLTEDDIKAITKLFVMWGETNAARKEWGALLSVLNQEPGNCAMISETFVKWLKDNGYTKAKTLTGEFTKRNDFQIVEDNAHTVVLFNNTFIVDLSAKQFNKKLDFPRFMKLPEFKKEWMRVS